MVLEQLFKTRWIEKKPSTSFLLGIIFSIIGFSTSVLIFRNTPHLIGITTIFFIVILAIPGISKLFDHEEQIEAKEKKGFLKDHESIIDFFIYFFLGMFCVFLIISLFSPELVFSKSNLLGIQNIKTIQGSNLPLPPDGSSVAGVIIKNNLFVMGVLFLLSFFYGSGALFIIVLNASIFASSFTDAIKSKLPETYYGAFTHTMCNLGTNFLHTIPEVIAYFLVAIAGGVVSKAVSKEKFWTKRFYRVVRDSLILLLLAVVALIGAALIETNISLSFDICANPLVLILVILLVASILVFELKRKKK